MIGQGIALMNDHAIKTLGPISLYPSLVHRTSEPAILGQYATWTGCDASQDSFCDYTLPGLTDRLYFFNGTDVSEIGVFPKQNAFVPASVDISGNTIRYQNPIQNTLFQLEIDNFNEQSENNAASFNAYLENGNLLLEKNNSTKKLIEPLNTDEEIRILDQSGDYLLFAHRPNLSSTQNLFLFNDTDDSLRLVDTAKFDTGTLYNNHIYYWEHVDYKRLYYARFDVANHTLPEPSTFILFGVAMSYNTSLNSDHWLRRLNVVKFLKPGGHRNEKANDLPERV
jgi:hypothetical protein